MRSGSRSASERAAYAVLSVLEQLRDEVKYDPRQARLPKGQTGGGQWTVDGRSQIQLRNAVANRLARAAIGAATTAPETAGVIGAATAAPLAMGVLGVSRTAGLYDHYATGAPMTPFLHMTGAAPDLDPLHRGYASPAASDQEKRDNECDEQLRKDDVNCAIYAGMYGMGTKG